MFTLALPILTAYMSDSAIYVYLCTPVYIHMLMYIVQYVTFCDVRGCVGIVCVILLP